MAVDYDSILGAIAPPVDQSNAKLRSAVALSPAEQASSAKYESTRGQDLLDQIKAEKNPAAKKAQQDYYDKTYGQSQPSTGGVNYDAVTSMLAPASSDQFPNTAGGGRGGQGGPTAAQATQASSAPQRAVAPSTPGQITSPEFDLTAHAVSSLAAPVWGGLKGLYTLAKTGGDVDAAVNAIHQGTTDATYAPRTQDGQTLSQGFDSNLNPVNWIPRASQYIGDTVGDAVGDKSPVLGAVAKGLGAVAPFALGSKTARDAAGNLSDLAKPGQAPLAEAARVEPTLQEPVKPRIKLNTDGSQTVLSPNIPKNGPAESVPVTSNSQQVNAPTLADASPELQSAVQALRDKGKPVNAEAVSRHVDAETLPVPMKLTEGQATLDPETISNEMNGRGKDKPTVSPDFYNQQGKALSQNVDAIRKTAAPDVVADNPVDHGQVLVDQYKTKGADALSEVSKNYQALKDAKGGDVFLNGGDVQKAVNAAMDNPEEYLDPHLPSSIKSTLAKYAADGPMSYTRFESLRTQLATAARSKAALEDGNISKAISAARNAVESLPMSDETADIKPLADKARASARAYHATLEADPAYAAAMNDSTPIGADSPLADKFVSKYIVNGNRAHVANMRSNLADSPIATQTITASTLDSLRRAAKADVETGKFNADGYNTTLERLRPKLGVLVDPKTAQQVQQVGRVAKYTTAQPKGSYVNNSNTLIGAAGQLGTDLIKKALAVKTYGASDVAGKVYNSMKAGKAAKNAIAPGAGISKLSDLSQ